MAMNENVSNFPSGMTGKKKATRPGLHPLHEAAMRIADLGMKTSRGKTKDLVGMLLTHGARAWRTTQPEARIHLYIRASSKGAPVRLRLR